MGKYGARLGLAVLGCWLVIGCGGGGSDGGNAGASAGNSGGGAGGTNTTGRGGNAGTTGPGGASGGSAGTTATGGSAGAAIGGSGGATAGSGGSAGAVATGGTSGAGAAGRGGSAGTATGGSAGTIATGGTSGAGAAGRGGSAGTATGGSAGTATGGSAGTATGGSAGTAAGGAGGSSCANNLVATAPAVPENRAAEDFSTSAATGGTIVAGTYHLTSLTLYTGPGGASTPTGNNRSQTTRVTGSIIDTVIANNGGTTRLTFSFEAAGSALTVNQICPSGGGSRALAYTATATTLTVWSPSTGSNLPEVQVFTLANPLCTNIFPSSAPVVAGERVAEAPPTLTGGTITPGTYHLTTYVFYTGPGGATGPAGQSRSETLRFTAGSGGSLTLEASIAATQGGTGQWLVLTGTASGSALSVTQICPTAGSPTSFQYSANATSFAIMSASNVVEFYTKQ